MPLTLSCFARTFRPTTCLLDQKCTDYQVGSSCSKYCLLPAGASRVEITLFPRAFAPTTLAVRLPKGPPWTHSPAAARISCFRIPAFFARIRPCQQCQHHSKVSPKRRQILRCPQTLYLGCSHNCRWSGINGMWPARMAGPDSGRRSLRATKGWPMPRGRHAGSEAHEPGFLRSGDPSPTPTTARSHSGVLLVLLADFLLARQPMAGREAANLAIAEP